MIHFFDNLEKCSLYAVELFTDRTRRAIAARGRFCAALAGGSTPQRMYTLLAGERHSTKVDWQHVHIFWSDERCVPATDARSNQRMARQALLAHIRLPEMNIHPIHGEILPAAAAHQYEAELKRFFPDQPPILDLVLLGLGSDGHTASLFPYDPILQEQERWVAAVHPAGQETPRVTMTIPLINQAETVVFLVSGAEKAEILQKVIEGKQHPDAVPAQFIRPRGGQPLWLVDQAAGNLLNKHTS